MKRKPDTFLGKLADPPGWIPAWILTAAVIWIARESASDPAWLPALNVLADVYKSTLAVWLAYKGVSSLSDAYSSRRQPPDIEP